MSSVSEQTLISDSAQPELRLPHGWSRILLAGIEAAVVQWALCVFIVGIAYWLESGNSWLVSTGWTEVLAFATNFWSGALFGAYPLGSVPATLLPSGLSLLCVGLSQLSLGVRRNVDSAALFVFPFVYAVIATMIAASGTGVGLLRVAFGAFLVGLISTGIQLLWRARKYRMDMDEALGLVSDERSDDRFLNWVIDRPRNIFRGLALGFQLLMILFLLGLLGLGAAIWNGWPRIMEINSLVGASGTGLVFSVLAQLFYLPLYVACVLSWLAGSGFYTGVGAFHSSFVVPDQALPAIPILGAVPVVPVQTWPSLWVPFFFLALYASWRSRRTIKDLGPMLLSAGILMLGVEALLCWVAAGAVGPGTLQFVGVPFVSSFLLIFVQTWVVYAAVRCVCSLQGVALLSKWWRVLVSSVSGFGARAEGDSGAA